MASWRQVTVQGSPAAVLRRLATALAEGDPAVRIGPAVEGTLVAASRRHRVETDEPGVAWIELTPLTPTTTLVEVGADDPGAAALVARITAAAGSGQAVALRGTAAARERRRRRHVRRAVAAASVLALVAGSAATYRVLAPPEPLAVDQAVAQFQQAPAPATPVAPAATQDPALPSEREEALPRRRVADARGQRSSAVATRPRPTRPSQSALAQDRSRDRQPADAGSDTQGARRRDAAAQPAPLPAAGVYTYATSGHEEIDQPSDRHDYPRETALTVHHTGCGFITRWQPLEQRWDETEICADDEVRTLTRMTTQREFFGQRKRSDYRCEPRSRAWHTDPGTTWTTRCSDKDSTVTTRFTVVGHEPVAVGRETVRAVHLQLRATVTGATRGTWTAQRWLHPETGLLLRLEGSTDVTSATPYGEVRYREQVRLDLQSLQPRR